MKYSSHVIEKCLEINKEITKEWILDEIIASKKLDSILKDQFGNYGNLNSYSESIKSGKREAIS